MKQVSVFYFLPFLFSYLYFILFFICCVDTKKEHKCMVRLLTMALGMDENKAEILLSPTKDTSSAIINEYFTNE